MKFIKSDYLSDLGIIFSYQNTPALSKVYFQLNDDKEVNKGQFVAIEHKQGKVIGLVVDIMRFNPYFEQTNTGINDSTDFLPVAEWNSTIVEVKPLGILEKDHFKRLNNPPFPGAKVFLPESNDLITFLGFESDGLELGYIQTTNTPVKINISRILQKHLAILAMSGAGKSYTVSVLLEELLSRPETKSVGVVLFDVHGEYKNFADPAKAPDTDFSSKVRHIKAKDLKIGLYEASISILNKIMNLTIPQYRELTKILRTLKREMQNGKIYDIEAVKKEVLENANNKVVDGLLTKLDHLEMQKFFSKISNFKIEQLVKPGYLTIIDLSDVLDMLKKQVLLAFFANNLFYLRRDKKIPPFVLILEEAHQFVPEGKSEDLVLARSIIETIAREGRKFGASLCLISQRPVRLSTTVLSQCNTHMLLRIINPNDLKHVEESSEGVDSKSRDIITSLDVGEALMVGSAVNYPLFFKVRKRKSQPNKYEFDLEQMTQEFLNNKKQKDEELDGFL